MMSTAESANSATPITAQGKLKYAFHDCKYSEIALALSKSLS